jgi:hypothetical protein
MHSKSTCVFMNENAFMVVESSTKTIDIGLKYGGFGA